MKIPDVLALIPAWNEGERIARVIHALPEGMPVLVVDDGSTDQTVDIALSAGAEVVKHDANKGKGVALTTGFTWAIERDIPSVLTLDADGQHDPQEAVKFIDAFNLGGEDLIIGRRSLHAIPFPRNLANRFSSWLLTRILEEPIFDNQSGYRMHSQRLLRALEMRRTGFEFEVDVILQTLQKGYSIGWVDIRTIYAKEIKSHFHPLRDTYKFFAVAWYAYQSQRENRRR